MSKRLYLSIAMVLSVMMVGCAENGHEDDVHASSSQLQSNKIEDKSSAMVAVGKILSDKEMNPDVAYKVGKKSVLAYHSLTKFGKKSDKLATYKASSGEVFGITKRYQTTTGIYYHLIQFQSNGFSNKKHPANSSYIKFWGEGGYVKANDMRRFHPVTSEWNYHKKVPYYVANPYSHRIWNNPVDTKHYTYISHVFDRLTTVQLYATKELVKSTGKHYVYLQTAGGKKLGWVVKKRSVLIAGKYRDVGKQLLKPKTHETLIKKVQSKASTHNRVTTNDSMATQQRVYLVKNRYHKIVRILVVGMDNRPTKLYLRGGRVTKLISYTYRRVPWKTVTGLKKLKKHYLAEHLYTNSAATKTSFYSKKNKKLVKAVTMGNDGTAMATVYRNGRVRFSTEIPKDLNTFPIADFD
ncbi:hypothetical protein [Levilactobacillus angrenensis]|uniref:Lipoprotein n=1 Tax=Levilactobacillus angrenensis TaxID=2486020 RepID=A0ABW1UCQ7_9LACO|nr:hypothetical protein [Levilactobacillus angrenensis]